MKKLLSIVFLAAICLALQAQNIRLASFNIRYADGDKGTDRCWQNRRDSLFRFLHHQDLGIICLQEVLEPQMADARLALKGYGFVGVGREDGKTKGEYAPIFYRKSEWKAIKKGVFWLSETPSVAGSMGWDAACTRLATWALLKNRHSGHRTIVINTHFDHVGHQARIESARLIMQKAQEIAAGIPLILTGDFNVPSVDPVYATITQNASFPLLDTQQAACPHLGVSYTFHGFGRMAPAWCAQIDFIFTSPAFHTLSTFIPEEDHTVPNAFYMSDHNPVIAELKF